MRKQSSPEHKSKHETVVVRVRHEEQCWLPLSLRILHVLIQPKKIQADISAKLNHNYCQ